VKLDLGNIHFFLFGQTACLENITPVVKIFLLRTPSFFFWWRRIVSPQLKAGLSLLITSTVPTSSHFSFEAYHVYACGISAFISTCCLLIFGPLLGAVFLGQKENLDPLEVCGVGFGVLLFPVTIPIELNSLQDSGVESFENKSEPEAFNKLGSSQIEGFFQSSVFDLLDDYSRNLMIPNKISQAKQTLNAKFVEISGKMWPMVGCFRSIIRSLIGFWNAISQHTALSAVFLLCRLMAKYLVLFYGLYTIYKRCL